MSVTRFSEDIGYVPDLNGCRKKIVEYCRDSEVAIDRLMEENAELREALIQHRRFCKEVVAGYEGVKFYEATNKLLNK